MRGVALTTVHWLLYPPKPKDTIIAVEETKAQKALAARNREREQNRLRMRRVREAQRAAKEAEQIPLG